MLLDFYSESPDNASPERYEFGELSGKYTLNQQCVIRNYSIKRVMHVLENNENTREEISKYVHNTVLLLDNIDAVWGEEVIPQMRRGKIQDPPHVTFDIHKARNLGIDPDYVILARITDPGEDKPERFWSTDFEVVFMRLHETGMGARDKEVLLARLSDICADEYGGCIRDIIDTPEVSLLQMKEKPFDKSVLVGRFNHNDLFFGSSELPEVFSKKVLSLLG